MAKHGVRRITNRGRDRVIGKFASLKMQQIIQWESQIERDCCYWLEFDRDVIAYRSQPLIISYIFEDRKLRHTPDFEVMRHSLQTGQYQYLEVKPYKKT
ncbi:TnsA endonuclease N-terminal domain-containing protein, partial [Acinetobacter baumannii]